MKYSVNYGNTTRTVANQNTQKEDHSSSHNAHDGTTIARLSSGLCCHEDGWSVEEMLMMPSSRMMRMLKLKILAWLHLHDKKQYC